MIQKPDDPNQMEFFCRADIAKEEPLLGMIDDVVNGLDLGALYARYSEAGRSFYDPSMQLKLLFYGYCDGVCSCRDLAKHVRYDIRYRYFCGSLRPDFRTLNRFRKDNLDFLSDYFAQMVLMCHDSGLLDTSFLAVDGTKIRASSSRSRTFRKRTRDELASHFRRRLRDDVAADNCDESSESDEDTTGTISEPVSGIKVTDPDARFMKTSDGGKRPCYNSQIVVDRNQIIVAADVSNNSDDSVQFRPMIEQSKENIPCEIDKVTADGGYYSGNNLKYADSEGIDLYLPVTKIGRVPDDRFYRDAFVYDDKTDRYRCPEGRHLHYRRSRQRKGISSRIYSGSASSCGRCKLRSQCTKRRVRELQISENYTYERRMRKKLETVTGRWIYRQRKSMVEPVFGNLKFNLGFVRFGLRSLKKVKGEFLLMCIAHNLRKLASFRRDLKLATSLKLALISLSLSISVVCCRIVEQFHHNYDIIRTKLVKLIYKPEYVHL